MDHTTVIYFNIDAVTGEEKIILPNKSINLNERTDIEPTSLDQNEKSTDLNQRKDVELRKPSYPVTCGLCPMTKRGRKKKFDTRFDFGRHFMYNHSVEGTICPKCEFDCGRMAHLEEHGVLCHAVSCSTGEKSQKLTWEKT